MKKRLYIIIPMVLTIILFWMLSIHYVTISSSLIPKPDYVCPQKYGWNDIYPGESQRSDVINILGTPYEKFHNYSLNGISETYSYPIKITEFEIFEARQYITFNLSGQVIYLNHLANNRGESSHTVSEYTEILGKDVGLIYMNSNCRPNSIKYCEPYFDYVLVWPECGLAIDVAPEHRCSDEYPFECCPTDLRSLYKHPWGKWWNGYCIGVDSDAYVFMEFLFVPTSMEGFTKNFLSEVPVTGKDLYELIFFTN